MKTKINLISILLIFSIGLFFFSCTQPSSEISEPTKIENTLKSVSLWNVISPVESQEILASMERVNAAIDSIGYPDAGYKLWQLKSEALTDFSFMVEGYWPDQNGYDTIHDNELYQAAMEAEEEIWEKLEMIQYNRFTKVSSE